MDDKPKFFSLQAHIGWLVALITALVGQGVTLIVKVGELTKSVEDLNTRIDTQQHAFEREIDTLRYPNGTARNGR